MPVTNFKRGLLWTFRLNKKEARIFLRSCRQASLTKSELFRLMIRFCLVEKKLKL
jgi:hypothetical protein